MTTEGGKPGKVLNSWERHDEDGSVDIKKVTLDNLPYQTSCKTNIKNYLWTQWKA